VCEPWTVLHHDVHDISINGLQDNAECWPAVVSTRQANCCCCCCCVSKCWWQGRRTCVWWRDGGGRRRQFCRCDRHSICCVHYRRVADEQSVVHLRQNKWVRAATFCLLTTVNDYSTTPTVIVMAAFQRSQIYVSQYPSVFLSSLTTEISGFKSHRCYFCQCSKCHCSDGINSN